MKNRIKKSIGYKLFLVTTLLLVINSMCTYGIIYLMMPNQYYKYKEMRIEGQLDNAVVDCKKLDINNIEEFFDNLSFENNGIILLNDQQRKTIYFTNFPKKRDITIPRESELPHFKNESKINHRTIYKSYRKIKFKNNNEVYNLYMNVPLQPISEASKVLILLIPYIGLVVVLISIIGGFIYSKVVSKPLLSINMVARKMANLNFKEKCPIKGEDEIGELSKSLNDLSYNLQISMENLQKANEQLLDDIAKERKIEKKRREFIATISHELKTPITILKGQIEGMLSNIGIYKDRDKYLKRNLDVLNDMEYIVKEMLQIFRIESNGFKLQKEKVNLSKIVEDCILKTSVIAMEKNIAIYKGINRNMFIYGDNKLIKKVIYNIITNAIKHSFANEKVYISINDTENKVLLKVQNTGVNIEEKELQEIFKPFYRIEKSRNRKSGGSGLGLYIVKKILDYHKAKYSISNNDIGVEFKIWLDKLD